MFKIILLLISLVHAQAESRLPEPSQPLAQFQAEIEENVKAIQEMGALCDGGARKWAKIQILRMRITENNLVRDMDNQLDRLPNACRKVAFAGKQLDFSGTELIIPQRIARSKEMSSRIKARCLRYWADWRVIERIYDQVGPLLGQWQAECVEGKTPRAAKTPPSSQTGSGGAVR